MKHEWKTIAPRSGPLVAVGDVGAPFRYSTSWELVCKKCKEYLPIPYDVLDIDNIMRFIKKQDRRNDCEVRRKKNK